MYAVKTVNNRQFKKLLRQRRGQRRLKMTLYFTYESLDTLKSFSLFLFVKTISEVVVAHSVKCETEILKIIRCGSRFLHNGEFGHFTLLFYRGRQRNVPRIITHVHSHCSANNIHEKITRF